MKQTAVPNEVLIDGRSLSLTGLSDFVANLERSGYFQKSVEIVNSTTDTSGGPQGEVIKFQIKAVFKGPGDVEVASAADTKGAFEAILSIEYQRIRARISVPKAASDVSHG